MKGLKCLKMIIFMAFFAFISIILPEKTVSAYELGSAYSLDIQSASGTTTSGAQSPIITNGPVTIIDFPGGYSSTITLNLPSAGIPARSLISINYSVRMFGEYTNSYAGITCRGLAVLVLVVLRANH